MRLAAITVSVALAITSAGSARSDAVLDPIAQARKASEQLSSKLAAAEYVYETTRKDAAIQAALYVHSVDLCYPEKAKAADQRVMDVFAEISAFDDIHKIYRDFFFETDIQRCGLKTREIADLSDPWAGSVGKAAREFANLGEIFAALELENTRLQDLKSGIRESVNSPSSAALAAAALRANKIAKGEMLDAGANPIPWNKAALLNETQQFKWELLRERTEERGQILPDFDVSAVIVTCLYSNDQRVVIHFSRTQDPSFAVNHSTGEKFIISAAGNQGMPIVFDGEQMTVWYRTMTIGSDDQIFLADCDPSIFVPS